MRAGLLAAALGVSLMACAAPSAPVTTADLAPITARWGVTAEACNADGGARDGVLEVTSAELIVGSENRAIYSSAWDGAVATLVTRAADDVTNRALEQTHLLTHDATAGTLTLENGAAGSPIVYQRCP